MMKVQSFLEGQWCAGNGTAVELFHAVNGEKVAEVSSGGIDFEGAVEYGRNVGGPKLRAMTFHQRARMLRGLAKYLTERKEELYKLSYATGATRFDSWLDIDGGIATLFTYAGKGRREFPDETFHVDGDPETLSKAGTFMGRHICVPLEGVAIHINAFNFPCWGMLEKLSPTLLAGMPAIIKPATSTCYLAERMVRLILESSILPEGALQLLCGHAGDLLGHVTCQDVVTFTGSASTAAKLRTHPAILANAVRLNIESDSLNCAILGPDAKPGTEEFDLFIKEVVREMTVKAGQKCTAIRRTIVPEVLTEAAVGALKKKLSEVKVGDPAIEGVKMGPLVSREQVREVTERVGQLRQAAELVFEQSAPERGAFFPPVLLYCDAPGKTTVPHEVEAFGPVSTVMPYSSVDEVIEMARLGQGSLVGSLFTADERVARQIVLGIGAYHGRLLVVDRTCAKESTGHGSPLPHLVHGGPGRAGGGEELGGSRSVLRYMQRVALQGSPSVLTAVCNQWMKGARQLPDTVHPFRKTFDELRIGETLLSGRRMITEEDVMKFADLSGDRFYAHTDEAAAAESIFGRRVAHGYLVLSAAAGLFVDPAKGAVLANYGLEHLRFTKPVYFGDSIQVRLTCKQKTAKEPREGEEPQGVVAWDVEVFNQHAETVAVYTILTLVKRSVI
jgi:oxepin-CoA hydrolase/3-oxo-5,6-dehydrosuberyl-CoA semialdehyde dehydrogenase